jgi:hypothetical protein
MKIKIGAEFSRPDGLGLKILTAAPSAYSASQAGKVN